MKIGMPKEIKPQEYRAAITPAGVHDLIRAGHEVVVQDATGVGAGFGDEDYSAAGARLVGSAKQVFAEADLIVKVKEPQAAERALLEPRHTLFTYLHLAADRTQAEELAASGAMCIAYETVTGPNDTLPLLAPMSEVAGRLAPQMGAQALLAPLGGSGTLLSGVPGVLPAEVVVIGGGVSGAQAAKVALGMGANVTVLDRSLDVLRRLDVVFSGHVRTAYSTAQSLQQVLSTADMVIGCVLVPGASAPKLISREHLGLMRRGSVLVDVAIDQGGCAETSKPTTHAAPTFAVDGIIHYCVANMPGCVPRTSTLALSAATLPFVRAIADKGARQAILDDTHLRNGLNLSRGKVTCRPVAEALGYEYTSPEEALTNAG